MKDEALKLALEALEYWDVHGKLHQPTEEAITAIKQALAAPVQEPFFKFRECEDSQANVTSPPAAPVLEPVAWVEYETGNHTCTPPAQRTWVGLTDDDIITAYETSGHKQAIRPQDVFAVASLARAIEAKLKEKNT